MPVSSHTPEIFGAFVAIRSEFEHHHRCQLILCDALENIADDLPDAVNVKTCLHIANTIQGIIQSAHHFEQGALFPLLDDALDEKIISRLTCEHQKDEGFSVELSDTLSAFAAGREQNIGKLSYMLRGFFEGLRRHIAFEQEVIMPLLEGFAQSD